MSGRRTTGAAGARRAAWVLGAVVAVSAAGGCRSCARDERTAPPVRTGLVVASVAGIDITSEDVAALRRATPGAPRRAQDVVDELVDLVLVALDARRRGEWTSAGPIDVASDAGRATLQALFAAQVRAHTDPAAALPRLQAYFEEHAQELTRAEERRTLQVVESLAPAASPAVIEAARAQLEAQLAPGRQSGAPAAGAFAALAQQSEARFLAGPHGRAYQQHATRSDLKLARFSHMADTGFQSFAELEGFWGRDFAAAVFAAPLATLGPPVRTRFGWHAIWIAAARPTPPKRFDEVREEVEDRVRAEAATRWIGELRRPARVEVNAGLIAELERVP